MYYYELHETDDDLFSDALLAHEVEFDESQFLEMVVEARDAVIASFEQDTLVEAVGRELERRHEFVLIDDTKLRAAVNVSVNEGETMIANVEERGFDADSDEYRSLLIEPDPEDG